MVYFFVSKDDDETTTPLTKSEACEYVHSLGFSWTIVHRLFVNFPAGQSDFIEDDGERGFDLYIYSEEMKD